MNLTTLDIAIIVSYILLTVVVGILFSRRASKNMESYFLGGKKIPWWVLGISNASGMFDITGTMWLVSMCFVYGLKSAWLPWIWPTFNQIFLMIYLSVWLRRSNVMTGAEWLATRFGTGRGARRSHTVVVIFALVSVIGFIAYAFKGIGKFAYTFLPWDISPDMYATILMVLTGLYVIKGGMVSVVITEVLQFLIMTIASIAVGFIAISKVSGDAIDQYVPEGWKDLFFGWTLDLDWTGIIDSVNPKIANDGYSLFGLFFAMMVFKGIAVSMAGPVPNYDMQRILATKNAKEAAKMSGFVSLVMFFPRYMMVAGLTILALVYLGPEVANKNSPFDFELILPYSINNFIPVGLTGLLLAGLLAAFMSTFAATVNAAPAYFVNDIYKKYIRADKSDKHYVRMSYLASLIVILVGITFGFIVDSINSVTLWIFGALFGGYSAANLLKWHWWRFNGEGYFWGMITGLVASLVFPLVAPGVQPLFGFPFIFLASLIGSIAGTYLTPADDESVLKAFYATVRPWGWWRPIKEKVLNENPDLSNIPGPGRDLFNVLIGIIWQLTLVVMPIYLVIRELWPLLIAFAVFVMTSVVLKKNWLDKIED